VIVAVLRESGHGQMVYGLHAELTRHGFLLKNTQKQYGQKYKTTTGAANMSQNSYAGMTEAQFLKQVVAVAKLRGWLIYHAKPAQVGERWATHFQGDAGFPDLVLSHPTGGLVFAELKAGRNKQSDAQLRWQRYLLEAEYECYCWYPKDLDAVIARLSDI